MDDPLTAILNGQWSAVTGWGLWIGTVSFFVTLVLTGRLRTNKEFKRLEDTVEKLQAALEKALDQNALLIQANAIVKKFFQEVLPRPRNRGGEK
jgi:hypothetical protein